MFILINENEELINLDLVTRIFMFERGRDWRQRYGIGFLFSNEDVETSTDYFYDDEAFRDDVFDSIRDNIKNLLVVD